MIDPVSSVILSRLVDAAFTALETGMAREDVLARVSELEKAGHTPDQIAADLAAMRKTSSAEARAK